MGAAEKKPSVTKKEAEPTCFLVTMSLLVFKTGGNMMETNASVEHYFREMVDDHSLFSDHDDFEVHVKNDSDADWDEEL